MPRTRLYTVERAEKTLPLVRRVVDDIVRIFRAHEKAIEARRALGPRPSPGTNAEARALALEAEIRHCEEEILRFQQELLDLGVELKDYRIGLVDWRSRLENRVVYLCWKRDEEDAIGWWHELESGFRSRQPITRENRAKFNDRAEGLPVRKRPSR